MRKKDKTALAETPAAIAERLKAIYSPDSGAHRGILSRLSRRLFKLADLAGIPDARRTAYSHRHEIYTRACELGHGESNEARELCREIVSVEGRLETRRRLAAEAPTAPAEVKPKRELVKADDYFSLVGLCRDEVFEMFEVKEGEDLKHWDACMVREKGEESDYMGRVIVCSAQPLTYRLEDGEEYTTPRAQIEKLYRVNPKPVGKADNLTDKERERAEWLRGKLEELGEEDDQIIRCTAPYKYEKELFDILQPIDADDWSQWEEDEEEDEE